MFWIFAENRRLKEKVKALEESLENEKELNRLRKDSGLGKCSIALCEACIHAVWWRDCFYKHRILGCDKSSDCADFVNKSTPWDK